jgi:hypothetical protein
VTPERLASSRCDSLWRLRTKRSRPPISTLMGIPVLQVFRIDKYAFIDPVKSMVK